MTGVYSIAEVIDSSHQSDKLTILHIMPKGFEKHQLKSLRAVANMVKDNGNIAYITNKLDTTVQILNIISGEY